MSNPSSVVEVSRNRIELVHCVSTQTNRTDHQVDR